MTNFNSLRVMYLIDQDALRDHDVAMLRAHGIVDISFANFKSSNNPEFKNYPNFEENECRRFYKKNLESLNVRNLTCDDNSFAWEVMNREFDIIFIDDSPLLVKVACKKFKGAIVIRYFGLDDDKTYTELIRQSLDAALEFYIKSASRRIWFGGGYEFLKKNESPLIADRIIHLPVSVVDSMPSQEWDGNDCSIVFVCPNIGVSSYFSAKYKNFKKVFDGLPYKVLGNQPIAVSDPNVLGQINEEEYNDILRRSRVIFFDSQEVNRSNYHFLAAMRIGVPVIFLSGGVLDRFGGDEILPGRCLTMQEARRKIEKILGNQSSLISEIRKAQYLFLKRLDSIDVKNSWLKGLKEISAGLDEWHSNITLRPKKVGPKKIAVLVTSDDLRSNVREGVAIAKAIFHGSREHNEDADVVLFHGDNPGGWADADLEFLPTGMSRRVFRWKILNKDEALRAMRYAGYEEWLPIHEQYIFPDDGMQQVLDCNLLLIVGDRLSLPLLPIRPFVLRVFDYLQRYEPIFSRGSDMPFLEAARRAEVVLVSSEFAKADALQYAGVNPSAVRKVPMIFKSPSILLEKERGELTKPYFVWCADMTMPLNWMRAMGALQIYYEELDGRLVCKILTFDNKVNRSVDFLKYYESFKSDLTEKIIRKCIKISSGMSDFKYRNILAASCFLWRPESLMEDDQHVIDAEILGIPSLASDSPIVKEIASDLSLNIAWMDSSSPRTMAMALKRMEQEATRFRPNLSEVKLKIEKYLETSVSAYWKEVRECL